MITLNSIITHYNNEKLYEEIKADFDDDKVVIIILNDLIYTSTGKMGTALYNDAIKTLELATEDDERIWASYDGLIIYLD